MGTKAGRVAVIYPVKSVAAYESRGVDAVMDGYTGNRRSWLKVFLDDRSFECSDLMKPSITHVLGISTRHSGIRVCD